MKVVAVIILMSCLAGCTDKEALPSGILKKEKMQAVLWDMIQAESYTTLFITKDSLKNAPVENVRLQQKIFAIHKISKEEFYNSYDYYTAHAEIMRAVFDSITVKGDREKYKRLYNNIPIPVAISLMPLPPLPPPILIPMPIPSLSPQQPVQSVDSTDIPVFNRMPKPIPKQHKPLLII